MVKRTSPDSVSEEFAESGAKLTVRNLNRSYVLIEGDRRALEFLARLIMAQAAYGEKDCGFQFSPRGPGNALFTKDSTRGFYIHVKHDEPLEPPPVKSVPKPSPRSKSRKPIRQSRKPVK
jgi:hypothetical protein